jgi:hypothetical protein
MPRFCSMRSASRRLVCARFALRASHVTQRAEDRVGWSTLVSEVFFAIGCGYLIQSSTATSLNELRRMHREAVEANQSKLNFIAKMR